MGTAPRRAFRADPQTAFIMKIDVVYVTINVSTSHEINTFYVKLGSTE